MEHVPLVNSETTQFKTTPEGDITELKITTKNGNCIFSGLRRFTETAVGRVTVLDSGIGSYTLNADGSISYNFPVMPIWAWIACILGVAAISCGAVFMIKKKKKN